MSTHYTLYGAPFSLYTAKVRAYLRRQGITFIEQPPGGARFSEQIVPKVGRWIMPVVECPDGELLQDGALILDYFEARAGRDSTIYPLTPVQRAIAHVFELFGSEGLLRPAMHYRWNFDETNLGFLANDFPAALAPGANAEQAGQVFEFISSRMRKAAASFGVSPDTHASIESSYTDFLARFSKHLRTMPYLQGGRPSLADYNLLGPLFPHLGRDPYPLQLMQRVAPEVFRWCERMNAPETSHIEFPEASDTFLPDGSVPETLKDLLRFVAEDYLPELEAHVSFTNQWLEARPNLVAGTNGLDKAGARGIGKATFNWRGHTVATGVMPYRLFLLQRLQDAVENNTAQARVLVNALFQETGLSPLLALRTHRRVERKGHLEVWGDIIAGR